MLMLYLIEFALLALIVLALVWATQQMLARAKTQARAQQLTQEVLQLEEARTIVLQHVQHEMAQGIPYEQAVLTVLSAGYMPGLSTPTINNESSK